jgi:RimJ/RimL family protein N-acetyltransferase
LNEIGCPSILRNGHEPEVELVPFQLERSNADLKTRYLGWLNDLDVVRSIASPALMEVKGPEFVESSFERFTRADSQGFFVRCRADGAFIGTAKLDGISSYNHTAWDGIMLGEGGYQGRGFAPKVYRILLAYAFQTVGLRRVNGGCNEHNHPMRKTFARLGYRHEGRIREVDFIDGEYSDHLYFGILEAEFWLHNQVDLQQNDPKSE